MNANTVLEVKDLTKYYGKLKALDALTMALPSGRVIGLLGENGCGKSTLFKVLAGVTSNYEGEVRIAGLPVGPESKAVVSFLPDVSFLTDSWRISYCADLYADFFADFNRPKFDELILFFQLDATSKLSELSKGMREKVQVALAMSRDAQVFLLDEPISGVDPAARDVILQAIVRDLHPESLVLISTHLIHDLEPILDGAVFMRQGRVLLAGDVDDLRAQHGKSIDELFREVYRWSPR